MGASTGDGKDLRRLHLWQIQGVRDIVVVSAIVSLVWMGYAMRVVTVPVLVAFALAYLVEPLVERLSNRGRMRRSLAVTLILVIAGVGIALTTTLAVPVIWGQTTALMQELRTRRVQQLLEEAERALPSGWSEPVGKLADWIESAAKPEVGTARLATGDAGQVDAEVVPPAQSHSEAPTQSPTQSPTKSPTNGPTPALIPAPASALAAGGATPESPAESEEEARVRRMVAEQVGAELTRRGITGDAPASPPAAVPFASLVGTGAQQVVSRAIDAITLLFLAFLVPFYFYFFSVAYPDAIKFFQGLVPEQRRDRINHLAREMDRAVSGFVRGRIIIAFVMGVMTAVGWIFCGVPYAIALGLAAGVLSIVPYLGFAVVPFAIGMLLLDQVALPADERMAWYLILVAPLAVFTVVQLIEGNLLTPIIAGKVTDLGPVSIFVAVLAGASLAGVYGMLLSIPAAACLKILWREVLLPRIREWSAGRRSDPLPLDSE